MKKTLATLLLSVIPLTIQAGEAMTKHQKMFYDYNATSIIGEEISMSQYKGKVVLVVNTASKCGFTPQYEGLQKLYEKYKDEGFVILGFPCNQFNQQEPGSEKEIKTFCTTNYHISFPLFEKIEVNGDKTHPLYKFLKSEATGFLWTKSIKWNFTKFLIDTEGKVLTRYGSSTKPKDIETDISKLLKR